MRLVLDTNTAISGLLWGGTPGRLIEAAKAGHVELVSSAPLLAELQGVLSRPKFAQQLAVRGVTVGDVFDGYAALVRLVVPAAIAPTVARSSLDDALELEPARAVACKAVRLRLLWQPGRVEGRLLRAGGSRTAARRVSLCLSWVHAADVLFDADLNSQTPGIALGNDVDHLPPAIVSLHAEARKSAGAGAHTAAVLACRKLLMNIAVDKGAAPGGSFHLVC